MFERRSTTSAGRGACGLALLIAASGCSETVDSIGYNGPGATTLRPIAGPASYPNAFRDVLGKTDAEISERIAALYDRLFHGTESPAVYVTEGTDLAYIKDVHHNDIRTEGIGLGMLVSVQLNKREEFDRLWRRAKQVNRLTKGAGAGYYESSCETVGGTPCLDPFGHQQFAMSLLLARQRWTPAAGSHDYGADALELLHVMRHKQDENGGIVDGVTDMVDPGHRLVFDMPDASSADRGRPSIVMPGYYTMWAQATGDPFWRRAVEQGRSYWHETAHATTGLMPLRARFDGTADPSGPTFVPEGYRSQLNMGIDYVWTGGDARLVEESDRLLTFFSSQGIEDYGRVFSLDGTMLDADRDDALVAVNGITALASTNTDRAAYIDAVWSLPFPTGSSRYYDGLIELLALMILGGQFRVL